MDSKKRFTLNFVIACVVLGALASAGTALGMIRITLWFLGNCGETADCRAAEWLIDYWWILFIPVCLAAAAALRLVHDRYLARMGPPRS